MFDQVNHFVLFALYLNASIAVLNILDSVPLFLIEHVEYFGDGTGSGQTEHYQTETIVVVLTEGLIQFRLSMVSV